MKKNRIVIIATMLICHILTSCTYGMPDKHNIEPDKSLASLIHEDGAYSYHGELDSNSNSYYIVNDYYHWKSNDRISIISKFKTYQQTTEYSCGPAVLLMVMSHYGIKQYDELEIANMAGTVPETGTSVEGMCSFLDQVGIKYDAHIGTDTVFEDFSDVAKFFEKNIKAGRPVMVDWTDWGGHWQAVIGIDKGSSDYPDDDMLILADPYDVTDYYQDGYYVFPLARFCTMWQEGACAGKTDPYIQPYVVAYK